MTRISSILEREALPKMFSRWKRARFSPTERVSSQFASIVFVSASRAPALMILLVYILVDKEVLLAPAINFRYPPRKNAWYVQWKCSNLLFNEVYSRSKPNVV